MGGDHLHSFASEDESSTLDNDDDDYSQISSYPSSFYRDGVRMRDEEESSRGSSGHLYTGYDEMGHGIPSNDPVDFDNNLRRRKISYNEIMRNYDELWARRECLYQSKNKILSYSPGAWINNGGNKRLQKFSLPITTTLLLVGPKGSGKSSLVNKISRVFENDKFASERAQVTYNSYNGEGTFFLQEYMIPRGSTSFCLFDTRSLSDDFADNDEMLQLWMMKGVRHGELVSRDSDSPRLKTSLKCKVQQSGTPSTEMKKINFVIFVVNGLCVLRAMNSHTEDGRRYMETLTRTFNCPYLSFKDDKPVIVVTHGDLLSLGDRARVRVYLGEKLGVPPAKQIFDIPDNTDPLTELTIVDMIRYSLEHSDKHMPCSESSEWVDTFKFSINKLKQEVFRPGMLSLMFLAMLLGIACVAFPMHQFHKRNTSLLESSNSRISFPYEPHYQHHPSYSEPIPPINYSQNQKPPPTPPQTLPPKFLVETQGHENREHEIPEAGLEKQEQKIPEAKHENREEKNPEAKSENLEQKNEEPVLETHQEIWEPEDYSTSQPTLPPKPVKERKHKSRSPPLIKQHPKAAVKWHKIRHLWMDD